MQYVISATETGSVIFPTDRFEEMVRDRWRDAAESFGVGVDGMLTATINPQEEPQFSVRVADTGDALFTDGTREQVAEVATWVIHLLPADLAAEVWLYDFNGHAVLRPEMEEADVWAGWTET